MDIERLELLTQELAELNWALRGQTDPNSRKEILERFFTILSEIESVEARGVNVDTKWF